MKTKLLLYAACATLMLAAWSQTSRARPLGVPLGDAEARRVVGGQTDCGSAYKAGSVNCPTGTVLCGSTAKVCADGTVSTLVVDNTKKDNEEPDGTVTADCTVGCITPCHTVSKLTLTKAASCKKK